MSSRSRPSSKRSSKASKQPGLLESLTRAERRTAVVEESNQPTGTVIDLDDDDPYKFVDSQSLLPDSDGWTAAAAAVSTGLDNDDDDDFTTTSLSKSTSASAVHRKAPSSAGGVSTPKRSRTLGGATGSAKRKPNPKSKQSSIQQEEWSEEDMKRAIEASILEKQREDRRQRQKMRESKADEEEQLLLAQYQSMAATTTTAGGKDWEREEGEEWREGGKREEREELTSGQPGLPSDRESLMQQESCSLYSEEQQSPPPPPPPPPPPITTTKVIGLSTSATPVPQLKSASVSLKKLSMKALRTKNGKRTSDYLEEEEKDEDDDDGEVQIITLQEEGETTVAPRGEGSSVATCRSSTSMKVMPKGMERYCTSIEDEIVPGDDDLDATPPILGGEAKREAVISKSLSRGAPVTAAPSKKQAVSDKQGEGGRTKSAKVGLSLKKGRKRLSDSGNSAFEELPHSSGAQGPASKRPRLEVLNPSGHTESSATKSSDIVSAAATCRPELTTNAELPTNAAIAAYSDMEVEFEVNQAPPTEPSVGATASEMGSREASDNSDMGRVAKETGVKPPVVSLTGTEKTQEITRKGIDFTMNKGEKMNELREKLNEKEEKLTTARSSAVDSAMETDNAAALLSAVRLHQRDLANAERASSTSSAKVAGGRGTKNTASELVRRVKADGWPPVKIQQLEKPRNSSLQAPPGVLPAEHTKVLIQCFNAYVAKLAMAQRKVLWRVKWGQPVSSFNKAGVNSLASGRRTRRSRATSIPYSEYALDLKSMAPSSRSKSSSPMVSSKRSTPSKSPASSIRQQLSPGGENDSDSDFEPSKAVAKQSNSKKSNIDSRAGKTTPTKSQRATKSRLTLGKRSPQLQERADKSLSPGVQFDKSFSPGVQFEREESPDILPPAAVRANRHSGESEKQLSISKPSGRRLEFGSTATAEKSTLSVSSPLPPPASTSESPRGTRVSPQFQGGDDDDNVLMLDLTSPSPPLLPPKPQEPKTTTTTDRDGTEDDGFVTNFSDGEKQKEKAVASPVRVIHDTTDDSNEEGHPQSLSTSAATTTTGASSSSQSGGWLDSRKPPPPSAVQKTKPKRQPAKKSNSSKAGSGGGNAQRKKKAENGGRGRGGGRGRRQAKKTTSAALRMRALIEKSDSEAESEHSSMEDSEGATSSKEAAPKKPSGQRPKLKRRRTMDSTDDSEMTDMELEERGGERGETGSSRVLTSQTDPVGRGKGQREVTGSKKGGLESVIDLTAESQLPQDHTSSPSPSPLVTTDDDDRISCPMCNKRFDSSVIQLHAEQCEGPESDSDHQWTESITRYTTSATHGKSEAAAGGRKGSLSMGKRQKQQQQRESGRGGRGGKGGKRGEGGEGERGRRKSYQLSLVQLVNKEREMRGEEEIDSDTTSGDDPLDPVVNLDDISTSDRGGRDPTASHQSLFTTVTAASGGYGGGGEREKKERPGAFEQLSEDEGGGGGGGFIIEPSPSSSPPQSEPMAIEDGEGGYIVDPSMISNSPMRCFTKLSDMEPQERALYEDQYKAKSGRGGQGRKSQQRTRRGGRRQLPPMTSEERESATWGRDDFGDLFNSDEGSKGHWRGGRERGGYRGRKYDWNRARSRGNGRGRGRAGSRTRGRNS